MVMVVIVPVVQLLQEPVSNFKAARSLPMRRVSIFSKKGNQCLVLIKRAKNGPRRAKRNQEGVNIVFTDQKRAFFVQKVQFFSRVGLGACDFAGIAIKLPVIIQPR